MPISPEIKFISVLLPEPFGPIIDTISPSEILAEMSLTNTFPLLS